MDSKWIFLWSFLLGTALQTACATTQTRHTNNWAVIVDTSIFWFNYRHIANALSMYRVVKSLGIPDTQIILMLADDMACSPRNIFLGEMYNNRDREVELYSDDIEVDYRGEDVTVENFLRVLSGRHPPGTPASKRLDTDDGSNVFIYMTGHGGDEFLKFKDSEEIGSQDIGDCFKQMWERRRYHEIFFAIDTCQATTMLNHFNSPNIVSIGSSGLGENSYSHHSDSDLGVSVIDRFTYHTLAFVEEKRKAGTIHRSTLQEMFRKYRKQDLFSNAGWKSSLSRPLDQVPLTDFLGSVLHVRDDVAPYETSLGENETTESVDNTVANGPSFEWSDWPM